MNFENNVDIPMDDDEDLPTNMVCVCGHTLTMHAFTLGNHGLVTGGCVTCGEKCRKFRWSGKYEKK